MQPCKEHWAALRARVEELGMTFLVAKSEAESVERNKRKFAAELAGEQPNKQDFDPLINAFYAILNRMFEMSPGVGLQMMVERDEPDEMPENRDHEGYNHYCPLCVIKRDYDKHLHGVDGMCGKPHCKIVVTAEEEPWDKTWVAQAVTAMHQQAVKIGLITAH